MIQEPYPSDLTDEEFQHIEPLLSKGIYRNAGRKAKHSRRTMLNAIFYVLRTGCQWTDLPHDFPPWKSVYSQFLRWRQRDLFAKINSDLRKMLRVLLGKKENTSAGIIDSQSVKTTEKKGSVAMTEAKKLKVGKDIYWWTTSDC